MDLIFREERLLRDMNQMAVVKNIEEIEASILLCRAKMGPIRNLNRTWLNQFY